MKRLLYILISLFVSVDMIFATPITRENLRLNIPDGSIITSDGKTPIQLLSLIQSILLKVVLPVIVVGASLYIAYELFTAEGDESKMKKAWKSIAYSAIALIAIALSYALVSIISRINL